MLFDLKIYSLKIYGCRIVPAPLLLLFNPFIQNVLVWVCSVLYCKGKCFCQSGAAWIKRNSLHRDIPSEICLFLVKYNSVHSLKITVWLWKIHIWIVDCVPESAGCYNNRFCIYAHSDTTEKAEWFHLFTAWSREKIINLTISVPPKVFGKFLILLFCHCCLCFDYDCKGTYKNWISK